MFVVRGIVVALAFFVLLYCLVSLLVASFWRCVKFLRTTSSRRFANLLFTLRVLPLLLSAAVTLAVAVPSFLLLEPRSIDEDMGPMPLLLGLVCVSLLALASFRVLIAHLQTSRVVANWLEGANSLDVGIAAPTFQATSGAPPLTLVGVSLPKVVVSEATVAVLSREELRVAIQHEVAHMRSRDNLKKLIFYCSPFPGMARLESEWQEAAELAADEAAVSNTRNALDLAAALIKLSRLVTVQTGPEFTMALVSSSAAVSQRVERLLAWSGTNRVSRARWWYAIPPLLVLVACVAAIYSPLLVETHQITEWLVR